tara:strand:- start:542 stop:1870 length:1329 start_codon:yes stop_codon:yes gene_type:complete
VFYIVEEESKLKSLEKFIKIGCYIEVISSNDNFHNGLAETVAIYLRMVKSNHGYIIPIDHNEGVNIPKERIYELLDKASNVYTLNKKELLYHLNIQKAIDVSLMYSMIHFDKLEVTSNNTTINWYYSKHGNNPNINKIIPITKLYERCEVKYDCIEEYIDKKNIPTGFDFYNNIATNVFYLLEQQGLGVETKPFIDKFKPRNPIYNLSNNRVFTSYNLYNSTSRPTNAFNSVNFAAIPKDSEYRNCFTPTNNFFVEFDFDGYHLRLLCDQINYQLTSESAHKQLAKNYFGTDDITDDQYKEAKQINFQAIYGKIPEEHKNLEIFKLVQEYIDNMWSVFKEIGIVCNPQSGKGFTDELKDMHPAKLMNYMMQSLETSNNILILKEVLRYLRNKKTFISLYTYDAILFDFSKEDGKETLEDIKKIMEQKGKFPVKFKYSTNLVL